MQDRVENTYQDLLTLIETVNQLDPMSYDQNFGTFSKNYADGYAIELRGETAKIYVHGKMIGDPDALINNDELNIEKVKELADGIIKLVEAFRDAPKLDETSKELANNIISSLNDIQNDLGYKSPRPGGR